MSGNCCKNWSPATKLRTDRTKFEWDKKWNKVTFGPFGSFSSSTILEQSVLCFAFQVCSGIALLVRCQLLVILTAKRWRHEPPTVIFFSESMFTWIDQPIRGHCSATSASFFQRVKLCPNINRVALIMLSQLISPVGDFGREKSLLTT